MPSLNFVLPHWAYWLLLIAFPLIAFLMVKRSRGASLNRPTLTLAYFIWATAGYLGLHRIYLKNYWGLLYLLLFAAMLWMSAAHDGQRVAVSNAGAEVTSAERAVERAERDAARARDRIARYEQDLETRTPGSALFRRAERGVAQERAKYDAALRGAREADAARAGATPALAAEEATLLSIEQRYWWILYALGAFLLIDAALMPRMLARARERLAAHPQERVTAAPDPEPDSRFAAQGGLSGWIDRLCLGAGEFVSYWTVLAVFAFSYEVVVRKAFNSPTDWVHESVVYLFAMQYMIAGAYAMLTENHVRVDVFYAKFSPRLKAIVDLITSVFFFIFVVTLLMAGFVFAMDSLGFGNTPLSALARGEIGIGAFFAEGGLFAMLGPNARNGEVVFSTWALPLWPVKIVLVIGALLLLLQGISRVIKDAHTALTGAPPPRGRLGQEPQEQGA